MNFFSLFKRNLIYKLKKKVSIDTDQINFENLDNLFRYYGSDKANFFKLTNKAGHGFSKFYAKKLEKYKEKKINILEIGSYAGASAAAFAKYLPNSKIFCFDINISNFKYKSKNIHVFGVDINNKKKIQTILTSIFSQHNFNEFDLIIDDGSHNLSDLLISFKLFFKIVKSGGLFIIEDLKHPNYYKYNKDINHIFMNDFLNNLSSKKKTLSNIFNEKEQEELMNTIEKVENFKGNLDSSDICFVTKN